VVDITKRNKEYEGDITRGYDITPPTPPNQTNWPACGTAFPAFPPPHPRGSPPLPPPSTHRCPEVDARGTRRGDRSSTHAARGATLEEVGGVSLYAARLGGRDALEKSGYFFPCEPPVVHYIICLNTTEAV
jgi:hypothetical protein